MRQPQALLAGLGAFLFSASLAVAASDLSLADKADKTEKTPLPDMTKIEQSFCDDFSDVKVHTGDASDGAVDSKGAQAFDTSDKVTFKEKPPECDLVGHELIHTIQGGEKTEENPPSTEGDAAKP